MVRKKRKKPRRRKMPPQTYEKLPCGCELVDMSPEHWPYVMLCRRHRSLSTNLWKTLVTEIEAREGY